MQNQVEMEVLAEKVVEKVVVVKMVEHEEVCPTTRTVTLDSFVRMVVDGNSWMHLETY